MGKDHVLNVNLRVKLVTPVILTDIQSVTTWLFDKITVYASCISGLFLPWLFE